MTEKERRNWMKEYYILHDWKEVTECLLGIRERRPEMLARWELDVKDFKRVHPWYRSIRF